MDNLSRISSFLQTPVAQGVLGTIFTWFVTASGAAVVYAVPEQISVKNERKFLDAALGFSAGVMVAASFWSMLLPVFNFLYIICLKFISQAIELGESMMGPDSRLGLFPSTAGFLLGCLVVQLADEMLPDPDDLNIFLEIDSTNSKDKSQPKQENIPEGDKSNGSLRQRKRQNDDIIVKSKVLGEDFKDDNKSLKRIMLLVLAMTVHNFPEGLAVGVAFGSIPTGHTTFQKALLLTIGIGIQNFPEGLAVSLPLFRQFTQKIKSSTGEKLDRKTIRSIKFRAFFYGQLSGSVELFGGFFGAYLVELSNTLLPYALGFAAGAMIFVVFDSIIPESHAKGNKLFASWGAIFGFLLMMILEVVLG